MTTRSIRVLALALACVLAGCACTQVGCANQLRFHVPADLVPGAAYDVTVCFDEACHSATLRAPDAQTADSEGTLWLWPDDDSIVLELGDGPFSSGHAVTFTLLNDDDEVIASFDDMIDLVESRPNGPWCDPTCWSADIGMEPPAGF